MAKKQPEWLKIEDVTRKLPVTLSAEEREKLKDRENAQGERVLMLERELVVKTDEGRWCAKVEAPTESTEAGRNDPLPEAADAKKPKRRRAKDTGEAAINTALGQSEGMEASA